MGRGLLSPATGVASPPAIPAAPASSPPASQPRPARAAPSIRPVPRLPRWGGAVLTVQAAVLATMLTRHEPWEDEAQAWLLARDASPLHLVVHDLRYEGSPGLWHLLLMPAAKLGMPFVTVQVIAGLLCLLGGYLVLRFAPFPAPVRALVPLSYFVLYQYGVVARSYALLAPLLWLLAMAWGRRHDHPVRFTVVLALLANVSLHGLIISAALTAVHVVTLHRIWDVLEAPLRRRHTLCLAGLGAMGVLLLAILWPPSDLVSSSAGWNLSPLHALRVGPLAGLRALSFEVTAVPVAAATCWYLWRVRCLWILVAPGAAVLGLFSVKYFSIWHEGTLTLVWLFALWVANDRVRRRSLQGVRRAQMTAMALTGLALTGQVWWSVASLSWDWQHAYSGAAEAATYIRDQGIDRQGIDGQGYASVAVGAYFPHDLFANMNGGDGPAYWHWSAGSTGLVQTNRQIVAAGRPWVIVALKIRGGTITCLSGYRIVRVFRGAIEWEGGGYEEDSYVLFQRTAAWDGVQPDDAGACASLGPD